VRSVLLAAIAIASAFGCSSHGGSSSSKPAGGATTAPVSTASPAPTTSSATTAPPASHSVTTGSGGTSTQTGSFTRQVTTPLTQGLTPITVSYNVFVPPGYVFDASKPVPLVVTELTPATYWEPIAQTSGFIVAEQQGYLGNGGFTFDYDPLVLQALLADVEATWNVDMKRVYLTGFSAGAHWSYTIGLANANVFAALGICSGDLLTAIQEGVWIPNATTQPQIPRLIPVGIRHGTQDTVVPVAQGQYARDQLTAAGFPVDYAELNQGHTVNTPELQDLWTYLEAQSLP